ncbi:MAG: efflux RND transporter periplasmic adaptor subunit [Thermoanaerobaculales bacterium]|nr:efflux RND transporter periplasmic adaptor subunit [Thermoanaerobaculales bacterium]
MLTTQRWGWTLVIGLMVLAALAAPKLLPLLDNNEPVADTAAKRVLRVKVHRVTPVELSEHLATIGTVRANESVEIVSEVSGKISAIHFDEGSRVARDDLLLEIDDSELAAERQRALHRVELAQRAEARQQQLLDDGVISSETYDVALGELNVFLAELRLIEAQLEKTEIRAPFGGIIGLRWVSPGAYLSSQTPIASLHDLDPVKIDFSVPERYASLLNLGDEITFSVEGSEREFTGAIYAMEPSVDAASRSLRMRARCPNADGALLPGTFANIDLAVRSATDALTVPAIAVIPELGGKKVYVAVDGRAEPRPVTTGIRGDREVQITAGLEAGDLVISSGILQLQPGLEVEIESPVEP